MRIYNLCYCFVLGDDSDGLEINFNRYEDVSDAYDVLFATVRDDIKAASEKFESVKSSCRARASEPLRGEIISATDYDCLFDIFADRKDCCNWMDIRFLKVMANCCNNKKLLSLIENYNHVIYSKKLYEIWNSNPHYFAKKDEFQGELKATFGDRDLDNVTVKELIKKKLQLAKKIALSITVIH